jgi:hypothetical protein
MFDSIQSRRSRMHSGPGTLLVVGLIGLGAWPFCATAADDGADMLNDSFYLSLGGFIVGTDTTLRVNGNEFDGDEIDLENSFGRSDLNRFRIDGFWRFANRHKLRFLWFDWNADRTKKLKEDFIFDDKLYQANATVNLNNGFSIYELAYEYAFLRREKFELTGTIGLHYTEFDVALKTKLDVNGEPVGSAAAKADASVGAPLPVIGIRWLQHLGQNFWFDASGQYFALAIDGYDGNLQDYRVGLTWQPRKYLGIGIGYNAFAINVDVEKSNWNGSLDWSYRGPLAFISASF